MHASMNRIYRLVWSHVHQTWVAVHERAKGKGKSANRRLIASVLLAASHSAMAGPTGGQVTAGNGTINQNGATTTVTQGSQNLSLNWQSFNTSSGETVNFLQPSASAIAVNRISGNSATQFYGTLNANGQVYLINPNGVLFGAGSQINVGGLVASTLDTGDAGLGGATRRFTGTGSGSIINQGAINSAKGGYVAFVGNTVANQGAIKAGTVALGAGSDVTLSFSGDSLVQLQVNQSTLNNLAENGGLINADGGAVWLSAGARDAVLASVVNNTGIIRARSVEQVGGTIVLGAGSAGTATNSGTLDAAGVAGGTTGGTTGGTVKVLGGAVTLAAGSLIDVSGAGGGGTALIGGNFLGAGPEQHAHTTTVQAGAAINADAINTGNGGNVAVWSDKITQFDGSITARGGSTAGNGGQVETSGKALDIKASASVSTAAPHGAAGNWLLDPDDITIGNPSIWNDPLYPENPQTINVDTRVLTNALNNGNVTIKTTGSSASCTGTTCTGTSGHGDIIVLDIIGLVTNYNDGNNVINWTGSTTLTLSAYRDVRFKFTPNVKYEGAPTGQDLGGSIIINSGAGKVVLRADNTAMGTGTVTFDDSSQNIVVLATGTTSVYYNPSSYNSPTDYNLNIYTPFDAYMAINVSGSAASKIYDGLTTTSVSALTTLLSMPGGLTLNTASAQGTFADKNAGSGKTVTITGVTASGNGATNSTTSDGATVVNYSGNNYYINGLDSKIATITAKATNLTGLTANSKTYDGTTSSTLSGSASVGAGIVNGDSVTLGSGSATFADANAGVGKAVTVSGYTLSGIDAGNYVLTQPSGLSATINKADLTLAGTKTYDGATTVAGSTLTATGVAGQQFSVTGAGDASNLSSKNVQSGAALASATGLSLSSSNGGLASNYNAIGVAGSSYTVTAKGITLTGISAVDKIYDATTTAALNTAGVAYSGLVGGDSVSLAGSGTGSFADKNAGANKAVSVSGYTLAGLDAGNYVVTQPSGLTATINKASLAVSGIAAVDKTYDATTGAALSGTATVAALGSDSVSVTGTGAGSFADKTAGANKAVSVSGYTLAGLDAGNYVVTQPSGLTATINKASLAVSGIAAVDKTYDATTGAALSGTAAVAALGSDSVSVTGAGVGSFADKTAGANKAGSVSGYTLAGPGIAAVDKTYDAATGAALSGTAAVAALGSDSVSVTGTGVGSFADKNAGANKAVSVSGYTLAGLDAGNYVVMQPSGLTATIARAAMTVSGITAADKVFDGSTAATVGTANATLAGKFGSDDITLASTGQFSDAAAGVGKTVKLSSTYGGADIGNYIVTGQAQAIASITGGPVVVPDTPTQQVQSAVTQVQSSLLPPQALAQSQVLSLSTTLVVQQLTDSGSSNSDSNERSKETMGLPLINTATGFGTPAPQLKIQNGGMQLPLVATSSKE